jgi:HEAT repeat protein
MNSKLTEIPFDKIVLALLDESKPFQPRYLYRLSDLNSADLAALQNTWPKVSLRRRQALVEDIRDMGLSDDLLDFSSLAKLALHDVDPQVRLLAVQTLDEYEELDLLPVFIEMMEHDEDVQVRAVSALALGTYIYLGEIEELPDKVLHNLEDHLIRVTQGRDGSLVRRRALEALGFSSRKEVSPLMEKAYASEDLDWLLSALNAMGRSYNVTWSEKVLAKLDDSLSSVRAEAATAAGELSLKKSTPRLLELLGDDDEGVRGAAIWALSEIGGEGVQKALEEMLENTEDDEETDLLEDALDNLEFVEGVGGFSLLDLSEEEEFVDEVDLDDEADLLEEDSEDDEEGRG